MLNREIRKGRPKFTYCLNVSSNVYKELRRGLFPKLPRIIKPLQKRQAKAKTDRWQACVSATATVKIKFIATNIYKVPFPN